MLNIAYLFQAVNFVVTLSMLPLILNNINSYQYAVWSIFLTLFGFTLQIQTAIQNFVIREISRSYHNNSLAQFEKSWTLTKKLYAALSLLVALPIYLGGTFYLYQTQLLNENIFISWTILTAGYIATYMFAPLNAVLLATDKSIINNKINIFTRVLYLITCILLLNIYKDIISISSAFFISVTIGSIILFYIVDIKSVRRKINHISDTKKIQNNLAFRNFYLYGLYSFCSFFLYSGTILVAGALFPANIVASYSLGMQIGALLSAVALTPLPVWLAKQIDAIVSKNIDEQLYQLAKTLWAVNFVFLVGAAFAATFASQIVAYVSDDISPIASTYFLIILISFGVEANIFVLANFCAANGDYRYVRTYALIAFATAVGGSSAAVYFESLLPLMLFPAIGQSLFSLPIMLFRVSALLSLPPQLFLRQLVIAVKLKLQSIQ